MSERETVTEIIVETTLEVDVPVDRGGELAVATQDRLESLATVRYVDVRTIEDVDAGSDGLAVTADCRLTLHIDGSTGDVSAVRDRLFEMDDVLGIDRFESVDGPYRIERW